MYMYTTTLVECCTDSHWYMHFLNQGYMSDIENLEGWLSPGGHSSGGTALTAKVRGLVQSWVATGFSQFPKNIPKPFHHVHV